MSKVRVSRSGVFREMMDVLPHDFIFEKYRFSTMDSGASTSAPIQAIKPSGIEERVLHSMAGKLVIDAREMRPHSYGLSTHTRGFHRIRPGRRSSCRQFLFVSDRQELDGHWHTMHLATVVHAKAAVFKTVDLNIDVYRSEFPAARSRLFRAGCRKICFCVRYGRVDFSLTQNCFFPHLTVLVRFTGDPSSVTFAILPLNASTLAITLFFGSSLLFYVLPRRRLRRSTRRRI